MPLYKVTRNVGDLSRDELDAAAFRAIVCAPQFSGLRWIRSYWDRQNGLLDCYYEAQSIEQLEAHARTARIPCDDVRLVDEVLPDPYIHA